MPNWRTICRHAPLLTPCVLLCAIALPHLDQGDWRGDSGWYSAIALQAWKSGDAWTLYAEPGRPYFNKPPLVFWIHGAFLRLFGAHLSIARVPTVLAAIGCVWVTGAIARRFVGSVNAALCASVLALTYEFFRRTREISLDLWQLFFMLLAVLAIVSARPGRNGLASAFGGVALGCALMCKPFMALIGLVPMVIWLVWIGRARQLPYLGATLVIALLVAAPWHVSMWVRHGDAFASQYFGTEVVARATGTPMGGQFAHEPWWFYLAQLGRGYWPWLAATIPAVITVLRPPSQSRRIVLIRLGVIWAACWLVALTLFPDRRDRYAVAVYPGLALACGGWLYGVCTPVARNLLRRVIAGALPIAAVAGLVFAAIPVRVQRPPDPQWAALHTWLAANAADGVWDGAFAGAPGARVYLETGQWPRPVRNADESVIAEPPVGALLVYHRRGGRVPGVDETKVFESGDLTVTRLDAAPWRPVPFADPGER